MPTAHYLVALAVPEARSVGHSCLRTQYTQGAAAQASPSRSVNRILSLDLITKFGVDQWLCGVDFNEVPMYAYRLKKLLSASVKAFAIFVTVFLIVQIAPGGPIANVLTRLLQANATNVPLHGPID